MKNSTNQISNIQKAREMQFASDGMRKNILEMANSYDIRFACLQGKTANIKEDSIRRGFFKVSDSYNDIREALDNMQAGDSILIDNGNYMIGSIHEDLKSILPGVVYNLHTGVKVSDENPIPAYNLNDVRCPKQFLSLYRKISESMPELADILENIEDPTEDNIDPNMNCRKWIVETWNEIHESLKDTNNNIIEGIAYTSFVI